MKLYITHSMDTCEYYAAFKDDFVHREKCLVGKDQHIG